MGAVHEDPGSPPPVPAVRLASFLPAAMSAIPEDERPPAERALTAPALPAPEGDLDGLLAGAPADALGFLLVEGVVFKETVVAGFSALEVLSAGDVLAPPAGRRPRGAPGAARYVAHGPVVLAVLGEEFRAAMRRWPALQDELRDQLVRQADRTSAHLATLHASRVEDRIRLLFADLAERCGRMTPEGAVIDLPLTHRTIGRLVVAKRPTVTLALQRLADDGTLLRAADGRWLVPRTPA